MPPCRSGGEVNWKLPVSLLLLFFLAGSVVHQQRRLSQIERDLSLLRFSVQNLEHQPKSPKTSFFEQYGPSELRLQQTQRTTAAPLSPPRRNPILSLRKADFDRTETPQQMIASALSGDLGALDRLDAFASRTVAEGQDSEAIQASLNQIRAAFALVSEEAGNGNNDALGILWRATRKSHLAGLATDALGHAAALGNEMALDILLNPEHYGILLSSAVGALVEVAETGNELAVEALASIAQDETHRALWYLVASGLQIPAEQGNEIAIETLMLLLNVGDDNVRAAARLGLERASFNGSTLALDALTRIPDEN